MNEIRALVTQALGLVEEFKNVANETRFDALNKAKSILNVDIPRNGHYAAFVNRGGDFYAAYVQLTQLVRDHEKDLIEFRYRRLRRPSANAMERANIIGATQSGNEAGNVIHMNTSQAAMTATKQSPSPSFAHKGTEVNENHTQALQLPHPERPEPASEPSHQNHPPRVNLGSALAPTHIKSSSGVISQSTISPTILHNKLSVSSSVLLLDVRMHTTFDMGHIPSKYIACLEPSTLRHGMSFVDIQDTLVIAPQNESASFDKAHLCELVVLYDDRTELLEGNVSFKIISDALQKAGIMCNVLKGGFRAWVALFPNDIISNGVRKPNGPRPWPRLSPPANPPPPKIPPKLNIWDSSTTNRHETAVNDANLSTVVPTTNNDAIITMPVPDTRFVPAQETSPRGDLVHPVASTMGNHGLRHFDHQRNPVDDSVIRFPTADLTPSHGSTHFGVSGSGGLDDRSQRELMNRSQGKNTAFIGEKRQVRSSIQSSIPQRTSSLIYKPSPKDGYADKPAKISIPSLRVTKLLSNPTTSHAPQIPYTEERVPSALLPLMGLKNLGNTCYMNCIIQCMLSIPQLIEPFSNSTYKQYINPNSKLGYRGYFADIFAMLVMQMLRPHAQRFIEPLQIKQLASQLRPDSFAGSDQQDCQEFLTFMLDGLHEDLNSNGDKPKEGPLDAKAEEKREAFGIRTASAIEWERYLSGDTSLIVDLFQGQYLSQLQCLSCKRTSTTYNAFSSLSLPISVTSSKLLGQQQHTSLKTCFDEFVKPEILDGDNAWNCPHCKKKRKTVKTLKISRLPPFLIIHLKRFKRSAIGTTTKLETPVDYPLRNLDLTKYWPQLHQNDNDSEQRQILSQIPVRGQYPPFIYDLRAVTLHHGSLRGGHYTAVIQKPGMGWFYFDDSNVVQVKEQAAVSKNAYVLVYRRRMQ